jgi:hypothetical protein
MPIERSVSLSKGKLNSNFLAKAAFSSTVSKLTPRMRTPLSSYSRGIGLGVEPQDDVLAPEIRKLDGLAVVILNFEARSFGTWL